MLSEQDNASCSSLLELLLLELLEPLIVFVFAVTTLSMGLAARYAPLYLTSPEAMLFTPSSCS